MALGPPRYLPLDLRKQLSADLAAGELAATRAFESIPTFTNWSLLHDQRERVLQAAMLYLTKAVEGFATALVKAAKSEPDRWLHRMDWLLEEWCKSAIAQMYFHLLPSAFYLVWRERLDFAAEVEADVERHARQHLLELGIERDQQAAQAYPQNITTNTVQYRRELVTKCRKARGYDTLHEFATAIGISTASIYAVIREDPTRGSEDARDRLRKHLKVSLSDWYRDTET